ncbi:hypothetical protein PAMA_013450 [Pampus argenteus]
MLLSPPLLLLPLLVVKPAEENTAVPPAAFYSTLMMTAFVTLISYLASPEGTSTCFASGHSETLSCDWTSAVRCSTGASS